MFTHVNGEQLPEILCVDGTTTQLFEILEDCRLFRLVQHFTCCSREVPVKVKYLVMDMNASYAPHFEIAWIQGYQSSLAMIQKNPIKIFFTGF
ncbi:hypothetical protein CBF29_03630 [Vagococcus elongatus]|uniref:Transposase IS204/IS1001/IS1096/IS1165 DDE domain-containing protein n=1 Tax=Vagococcus elongatus TaxID=180344 RepID=A0A430B0W3_9ENTE|nr:hypothetical protein CBF29_03630 [Vagococcus elongatus]